MKPNRWANACLKTLAFTLALVTLVVALAGGVGTVACLGMEVYNRTEAEAAEEVTQELSWTLASNLADFYAQDTLGDMEQIRWDAYYQFYENPEDTSIRYKIKDGEGKTLVSNYRGQNTRGEYELATNAGYYTGQRVYVYEFLDKQGELNQVTSADLWLEETPPATESVEPQEPQDPGEDRTAVTVPEETTEVEPTSPPTESNTLPSTEPTLPTTEPDSAETTEGQEAIPDTTMPPVDTGRPDSYRADSIKPWTPEDLVIVDSYVIEQYVPVEETWTVTVYVLEELVEGDLYSTRLRLVNFLYDCKTLFPVAMAMGLLLLVLLVVYLLCAAGHRPGKEEITLNPFDKIPLDLYLAAVVAGIVALVALACELVDLLSWRYETIGQSEFWLVIAALAAEVMAAGVLALAFFMSLATRLKKGEGYVWRRTVIFWCLKLLGKGLGYLWKGIRFLFRGAVRLLRLLPLVWQWGLLTLGLLFVSLLFLLNRAWGGILFCGLLWLLLSVYLAYGFGSIRQAAQDMAQGQLERRVSTRFLFGHFRFMAEDLNRLGAGAGVEVERRMRSERMKTELITNVSHDIKTPLTSVVSYVDLLQKPHTPQEQEEYLEVLARQSQRLKKLTEDLVEMSKASSGNLTVNLAQTNVTELINQALAEYEGKIGSADLRLVENLPEGEPVVAWADGRLFWRVMDNILGNCVKYAMPGTRLYVDVRQEGAVVQVSVKNISKEPLNIPVQELMERFVRGDRSRNTEGSGLGLNIARSLMELQGGTLDLAVDGDLFKVILTLRTEP